MKTPKPPGLSPAPPSGFVLHGSPETSERGSRVASLVAFAVAALLGIALLVMALGPHRIGDYMTETDFYGAYAEGAAQLQRGQLDPARYGVIGPVYEVTLALVGFVARDLFLAAELISVASVVAIVLLWFMLLRARAGPRVALMAVLFMAVNAYLFRFGYAATTDVLSIALQAGALFVLLTRRGDRAFLWAGLLGALAFLARYNGIYLLPAAWIVVMLGGSLADRRARAALLFTAGFLAPVVPWILYSLAQGNALSFQLHHNIAYEVFARAQGIPWDDYQRTLQPQFTSLGQVIARDPGAVLQRMLFNTWDHLRLDGLRLLGWPAALAAGIGLVLSWRDGSLRRVWPVLVAGVLLFGTLVPVFYSERYSMALLPMYATFAGIAFGSPLFALARGRLWLKPLLAVVPLVLALMATWALQVRVLSQLPLEVIPCAATLRSLKADDDRVIARKGHVAYHAGVRPLGFPFADSLSQLAAYAREGNARWLYFSWPEAETRPQFWYLLDTSAVVPGLTVRHATRNNPAVLYEIGPEFGQQPTWFDNDTLRALHNTHARLLVDGHNTTALHNYGRLLRVLGRDQEARRAFEQLVRLTPDDLGTLLMLGDLLLRTHDLQRAAQVFSNAETRHPGSVEARAGRGWASLLDGNPREAAALWQPIIMVTRDRETLERMVELYDMLGDRSSRAAARQALARAQEAP